MEEMSTLNLMSELLLKNSLPRVKEGLKALSCMLNLSSD